jgi:hypothetical protein
MTEYEKAVQYGLELIAKQNPDQIKKNQDKLINRVKGRYFDRDKVVA